MVEAVNDVPRNQEHIDRTADMVERRVATAAAGIQQQLLGITKQIDARVDGNREQSEARLNALDELSITRTQALKEHMEATIRGLRERNDERWEGFKAVTVTRFQEVMITAQQRNDELRELFIQKLDAGEKALVLQAREYERRLEALNHERIRIQAIQDQFVRQDLYAKDMERLYTERQNQLAAAEGSRAAAEAAAATNRRTTVTAAIATGLSLIGLIISVVLRFVGPR